MQLKALRREKNLAFSENTHVVKSAVKGHPKNSGSRIEAQRVVEQGGEAEN